MKKHLLKTFILLVINYNSIFSQYISVTGGNVPKCAGQAVTLTYHKSTGLLGTNTSTRWWSVANPCGAGLSPFAIGNPLTVYPTVTTTYWAWDYTGTACVEIASITITVNSLPNVTANSTASIICNGSSVILTGGGASTYTWSNGVINGTAFNPATTTTYTVSGTDANGCVNSATKTVTVNTTPTITANSGTICNGQSFTITPSGASTYTYSSGTAIVSPTTNTTYTVTGTSTQGCVNSTGSISSVTVNALPIITVNSGTICKGQSFTITPSGANTYTYSSGTAIVSPTTNTTYTVTGTSTQGCVNSTGSISSVTVNALPTVMATTNNTLLCVGQSATLSATGANTYTWNTNSNASSIAVSPTAQTTYTVNGTDANGCSNTATIIQDVSLCTGINSLAEALEARLNIYPNPFNDKITVVSNGTKQTVLIFNELGFISYKTIMETEKIEIDLSNHSAGIYFIKVGSVTKKLIKE
ncbi:MAG: T9SS type A sorting domain-containing protein [Bacteroidia bacterium]